MGQRSVQVKLRVRWTSGMRDPSDVATAWAAALEDGELVSAAGVSGIREDAGAERTTTLLVLIQGAATPTEGLALASRQAVRVIGQDPHISEIRPVAAWAVP